MAWFWALPVTAGPLAERIEQFPNWQHPPALSAAGTDLFYPDWLLGNWWVTSTLTEAIAPQAPTIITPGFAANQQLIGQPVTFPIRFQRRADGRVIADRGFNALSIAQAYLGKEAVLAVKLDPRSVNRQITLLRSPCPTQKLCQRQLISEIKRRGVEANSADQLITSELFEQQFRGQPQLYFNQVENTTVYQRLKTPRSQIVAQQVTAIYLSPQDSQYFQVRDQPVALYQYQLQFSPMPEPSPSTHAL